MRISVLLIDALALLHDLCNLGLAALDSLSVGRNGVLTRHNALRCMRSCALGIKVVRKYGEGLAWMLGSKLGPELIDTLLGRLLLRLPLLRRRRHVPSDDYDRVISGVSPAVVHRVSD